MSGGLVTAAYIVAAILFIFSLAGLSKHETSQQGNNFGIAGMAIALIIFFAVGVTFCCVGKRCGKREEKRHQRCQPG